MKLNNIDWNMMFEALKETLYMTLWTTIITFFLGLLIGLILFLTSKKNHLLLKLTNGIISSLVNVFRSIPFVILIILLVPYTKLLVGTMLGPTAALPALIVGAAPFYARLVVIGLKEVDKGVIEASKAMGANTIQVIYKVLIPESLPALLSGITVTCVMLVGYTALAGIIGAGGLGQLAYMDGFQRGRYEITFVSTLIILGIVFIIQLIGDSFTKLVDKR